MRSFEERLPLDFVKQFGTIAYEPPTEELIDPFDACQMFDDELGTQTISILTKYIERDGRLKNIPAQIDSTRLTSIWYGPEGINSIYMTLNPAPESYAGAMTDPGTGQPSQIFDALFGNRRAQLTDPATGKVMVPALANRVFAIEAGHGQNYFWINDVSGGDETKAFELYEALRLRDIATLPLGTPSSRAQQYWSENFQGYRDKLAEYRGISDDTTFYQLLMRNAAAYYNLPGKGVASRLADEVLLATGLESI